MIGNGQGNDKDAADATSCPHYFPPRGLRHHVAVPHRRHRYRRPPERFRDARELAVLVLLGEVCEAGEHEDADGEEHDQQTELLVAAPQRVPERLQTDRVAREFQDPQNAHDPEYLDDPANVLELFGAVAVLVQTEWYVVWNDGEQVDAVEGSFEELLLVRGRPEARSRTRSWTIRCRPSLPWPGARCPHAFRSPCLARMESYWASERWSRWRWRILRSTPESGRNKINNYFVANNRGNCTTFGSVWCYTRLSGCLSEGPHQTWSTETSMRQIWRPSSLSPCTPSRLMKVIDYIERLMFFSSNPDGAGMPMYCYDPCSNCENWKGGHHTDNPYWEDHSDLGNWGTVNLPNSPSIWSLVLIY